MTLSTDVVDAALRLYRRPTTTPSPLRTRLGFRQLQRAQPGQSDMGVTRTLLDAALAQFTAQGPYFVAALH